jgi:hypothetical protein
LLFGTAAAQTQPPPRALPVVEEFGAAAFGVLPSGFAAWGGLSGAALTNAAKAGASVPAADAAVSAATTAQTTGGVYGYASGGDARLYIQTSSNTTNGANQLALALDTRGFTAVTLDYRIDLPSPQLRTVGVLCQCRIGTSGAWTDLTPVSGANPFSHAGATAPPPAAVRVQLPPQTGHQPVVQVRWATWRGTEGGNSAGLAVDGIVVSGTPIANSLTLSISPGEISEAGGGATATATVTAAAPVTADLALDVTVSDPSEAVVADLDPVVIPAGSSQAQFTLQAVDDLAFDGPQTVSVTAAAAAALPATATLTVTDDEDAWSPPEQHYAAAAGLSGAALKAALRAIAATGQRTYAYADTFAPLRAIHADPADANRVLTVYSGTSVGKNEVYRPDAGLDPDLTWSREHLWPVSYGLDPEGVDPGATDGDAGPDYTDLFNLRPAVHTVNQQRGNAYFDETSGTPVVPPLAPLCSHDSNSWEPRDVEKGDLARAMLYMAVRYDGGDAKTLDLELGNEPSTAAGRFGHLATLLRWHREDPVDLGERQRNQLIFATYQHNRNPFVDHPEYAAMVWGGVRVEPAVLAVAEGGAGAAYTVVLTSQPAAAVTVQALATPAGQVTLTPAAVTFTPEVWNQPQTLTVSAADDAVHEAPLSVTINHQLVTADPYYATLAPDAVVVTVTDDDPLIPPGVLPLYFGGPWSPLPAPGFLGTGLGTYSSSLGTDTGEGSVRFDGTGDRLTIAFSGTPGTLSYLLKGNPGSGTATAGLFTALQSADGESFSTLREHLDTSNATESFTITLGPASRFVTFVYETKTSGNIQLDGLAITAASRWTLWQDAHQLSGPDAAATADPDRDGLTNLAEYALGRSPVEPGGSVGMIATPAGGLRLTAVLRTDDPALTITAETSVDLTDPGAWTGAGVTRTAAADQSGVPAGFVRTVFEAAPGGAPARYLRLRCALP